MFDTVLIPTDGSQRAEHAVGHGLALAHKYGATVHALYVVDSDELPSSLEELPEASDLQSDLKSAGNEALTHIETQAHALGPKIETEIRVGSPVSEILTYTNEIDADLLVMGPHRQSRLERFLRKSVVEAVIRETSVPVLSVQSDNVSRTADYQKVLLATDGRVGANRATMYALDIASTYDATLHALTVLEQRLLRSSSLRSYLENEADRTLRRVTKAAAQQNISVVTAQREGVPHEEIVTYAERYGMELVVMGSSNRPSIDLLFMGSVATNTFRSIQCPLLITSQESSSE
jgi:nucleotide-binding universal stress UspA family protein